MRHKRFFLIWRVGAAAAGLLVCTWLMWGAARAGASRLLSNYGAGAGLLEAADQAIKFSDTDPEGYVARALVLLNTGEAAAAAKDFERAISLRPRDYLLWMQLGHTRDQAGDTTGAVMAYEQAVRRAPHYAHTHWQLGNLLLRAGRYDEAFASLRRAAASQPALTAQMIDLTWGIYKGDARAVESVVQPQTSAARASLAIYFAQRGKAEDAIRLFRETSKISSQERRALLTALLAARNFPEAYEVWESGDESKTGGSQKAAIIDGSFEGDISFDDPGFGWHIRPDVQAVQISLDSRHPSAGARSLRVHWNGNPSPSTAIFSQVVLVTPGTRYQLSFDARARELVTAGPPTITVTDAGNSGGGQANNSKARLAQITPFSEGTTNWGKYNLSFETGETTRAVLITLQRQGCPTPLCPIFGQTWFDNFVLQ